MTSAENMPSGEEGTERAEALAARIARLTDLVAARSDETSRQLRQHLDVLSDTLRKKTGPGSAPALSPPEPGEVVVAIPPELDLIEAIVTGQSVGQGAVGDTYEELFGLARLEEEASDIVVATADLPERLEAEAARAASEAEDEVSASPDPEAEAGQGPDASADVPDSSPQTMASAAESQSPDLSEGADPDEIAGVDAEEGPAVEAPAITPDPEAAPSEASVADEAATTVESPLPQSVPGASSEDSGGWDPVSVSPPDFGAEVNPSMELEVPEAVRLALQDEEADAPAEDVTETWFDEPHAGAPPLPPADDTAGEPISLGTQDVLTTMDTDVLNAARDEARHVLASLGAEPGDTVPEPDPLEPLERLARQSTPAQHRPHPRAVALLPRHLAYEALAAPIRVNPDGGLVCLVPEEYESERIYRLASTLERRVVAIEVPHTEVMDALESAYGPVGGVDQDALLLAISDESRSPPRGLMGRMSRWLRNT